MNNRTTEAPPNVEWSLAGRLKTMTLPDLLQWLQMGRKSGTIEIVIESFRKTVYVRDGFVFFASSSKPQERLGQFLVHRGDITRALLVQALDLWERQGGREKLSEILVAQGHISRETMLQRIKELVMEIIYDLFLYEEGVFTYQEDYLPDYVVQSFQLSSQELILEGLWRLDEYRRNMGRLPSLDRVLARTGDGLEKLESLGPEAKAIYELINGRNDVGTILFKAPIARLDAQIALINLINENIVTIQTMNVAQIVEGKLDQIIERGLDLLRSADVMGALKAAKEAREVVNERGRDVDNMTDLIQRVAEFEAHLFQTISRAVETRLGGLDGPLEVSPAALSSAVADELTTEEGFLLSRIGLRSTLREVLVTSGLPKKRTYVMLLNLMNMGLIRSPGNV